MFQNFAIMHIVYIYKHYRLLKYQHVTANFIGTLFRRTVEDYIKVANTFGIFYLEQVIDILMVYMVSIALF